MNKALLVASMAVVVVVFVVLVLWKRKTVSARRDENVAKKATFAVMQGEIDGYPVFATIDIGLRDFRDKQDLPFFLSVSAPLIKPTDHGLPSDADSEALNTWEGVVEAQLRPLGKYAYIGRVTWNGQRELLFYVSDHQAALEALKSLSNAHSTRTFAFTCDRDEAWEHARFWLNHT